MFTDKILNAKSAPQSKAKFPPICSTNNKIQRTCAIPYDDCPSARDIIARIRDQRDNDVTMFGFE